MHCREFRELADSYLGNELIVETNHELLLHLEQCVVCRNELAARRELRSRLRQAFANAPENQMPDGFAHRLEHVLREQAGMGSAGHIRTQWKRAWIGLAAGILIASMFGLVFWQLRVKNPASEAVQNKNQSPVAEPNSNAVELAVSAATVHRDCAIEFRLAERPISLTAAARNHDAVYRELDGVVRAQVARLPVETELVEAHSCILLGRRFAHLVLRQRGQVISVLVTDRQHEDGNVSREVIECSQFDGYHISCFQTAKHAVFVVSSLSEGENLALARSLTPELHEHISREESGT